jgi:dTDP-4-dehydrorhamnose 3,5-epimerase
LNFTATQIPGCYLIDPEIKADHRGWFTRTFCSNEFSETGFTKHWLQINHSMNLKKGTWRGLHYQQHPFTEAKLVRCIRGAIADVVVDLRRGSTSFLKHIIIELSAENKRMIFIPEGCAHGFLTVTDNTELIYHHSAVYTAAAECGIHYADPALNIQLPDPVMVISDRDKNFSHLPTNFTGL